MKSKNPIFFKCRMSVYQLHRCNKIRVETAAHPCRASVSDGWCERSHVKSWVRGISMKHVSYFHSVHWFYSVITCNSIWQANSWKWHIMSAVRTSFHDLFFLGDTSPYPNSTSENMLSGWCMCTIWWPSLMWIFITLTLLVQTTMESSCYRLSRYREFEWQGRETGP